MPTSPAQVLIVGAGPVGLVCALALAQAGISVRIVDKLSKPAAGQRGAGITPRTLEAYKFLGLLDVVKRRGGPIKDVLRYDADGKPQEPHKLVPECDLTPDVPEPNYWVLGQDAACEILRDHLKTFGISVEFGTELINFEQDDEGVTAELKNAEDQQELSARFKFLVGSDGGKSAIRKLAGIPFIGETSEEFTLAIGEVELSGLDKMHMHQFRSTAGAMFIAWAVYGRDTEFSIAAFGLDTLRATSDVEYLQQHIEEVTKNPNIKIGKVAQLDRWRLNVRMAEKFRAERVFLAGDAGHVHSPAGGQGMNSGLQDSMNLAWKLALVCKGLAPISLLDTYDEERQPVIREMLNLTVTIFNENAKRWSLPVKAAERPLSVRQLGVNCRWSSIVVDELQEGELIVSSALEPTNAYGAGQDDRLHAGDRAPDAPGLVDAKTGSHNTLFDIFKATRHTVVCFDDSLVNDLRVIISRCPKDVIRTVVVQQSGVPLAPRDDHVLIDSEGHAARAYGITTGVKVTVVRPDGVVGALAKTSQGVESYLSKIFLGLLD